MKNTKQNKIFILAIAIALIIPLAFALQSGFLEVKTLCLRGDCITEFADSNVTLDDAYNHGSGERTIFVDDGNVVWDLGNNDSFRIFQSNRNLNTGLIVDARRIEFIVDSIFGSRFDVFLQGTGDFPAGAGFFDDDSNSPILIMNRAGVFNIGPTVQAVTWFPLSDGIYDLGGVGEVGGDFRWRDLYLSGTIKGQGEAAGGTFSFDLNGDSGNFDTIGDVNSFDLLVRSDLNNNAAGSDANFNRLEADFFFGDGAGITGLNFTTDTTLDTNAAASFSFRSTANGWPGIQTYDNGLVSEGTLAMSGGSQINFRSSGSNILSPGVNDLDISVNDQLIFKSSSVDIIEIVSEGMLIHIGDLNIFQGQANIFDLNVTNAVFTGDLNVFDGQLNAFDVNITNADITNDLNVFEGQANINDANITNLTVTDTQGVDANYTGTVNVDLNLTVQKDIILQQGQRICGDVDCNSFITHDGTGWIFQS